MILQILVFIVGLALLWGGAELLIRYSSALARSVGISPVIIGLTIVSIGTSLPEFVVSLTAALQNTMGISIGNIIGSNIANIGLILGIGALLSTLQVQKSWVKKEVPLMILFTLLFTLFARTSFLISRSEGLVLTSLLFLFLGYLFHNSRSEMKEFKELKELGNIDVKQLTTAKKILYLALSLAGIGLLIAGSKLTVTSGTAIARTIGVSDTVIGLTLIAVGTSLPELATTIVGVVHGETDIVVGNVVGSNIFNLLFIGGVVSIIHPIPIERQLFSVEFPYLIGLSILLWPIMRIRLNVHRWEGLFLFISYVLFVVLTFSI